MKVHIDDFLPAWKHKGDELAFSKAKGGELWVPLLEKCYSKCFGSYERIEAGYPKLAFFDLTGIPS
jgi:hypothetical protein